MLAFSRLTSVLLFVLSLSFLTCAAPTIGKSQELAVRGDDAGVTVLNLLVGLKADLEVEANACAAVTTLVEAEAHLDVITKRVKVVADACVKIGANAVVSGDIKAKIAAELALIIKVIVKICASLVAKLGVNVAILLCVQIDAIVKVLFLSVDACVSGVVALCVKLLGDVDVNVLLKLNLDLCAQVLGLVKVKVAAAVGVSL
ncbi:unnamed protein product [Rhizoctonia solani]|uniref:Transmembrane protein n=1 Tax=Rhizoctonia solani TaxID=456999 RepID=A0A8H3BAL4_9AGAM|nr:unnamed protein product [Rhizoctonia solani]CAE6472447.1 unnamed protein product [Rhizoctonia solani]